MILISSFQSLPLESSKQGNNINDSRQGVLTRARAVVIVPRPAKRMSAEPPRLMLVDRNEDGPQ